MNILHIIRDLEPGTGGPVAATIALSQMQKQAGHNVTILTISRDEIGTSDQNGVCVIRLQSRFWKWRYSAEFYSVATKEIDEADIVHVHTVWEHTTYAAAKICHKLGKPFVLRPCGMLDEWSMKQGGAFKRIYYKFVGVGIIAQAALINFASKGEQESSQLYINEATSFVLPNPVNVVYQELLELNTDNRNVPKILFVGRLHPHKQIELIIEAIEQLHKKGRNVTLQLAGDGEEEYKQSLIEKVKKSNLTSAVQWLGAVNITGLKQLYRQAYCLVLPSMHENFGNVLCEAMSQACPVIVSKGVHIHKDVSSAKTGMVINDNSVSLTNAIETMLEHEKDHDEMSQNARIYAEENYFTGIVNSKLIAHYKTVMSQGH